MSLKGVRIGLGLTGSHCTMDEVMIELKRLVQQGAEVFPIISLSVDEVDTRYGSPEKWKAQLRDITGKDVINTITGAEPVGPGKLFDVMVLAPCTGNTLAKLANAITDTPVLMATKAHLRNQRPVVIGISTNDGLGLNAKNIGLLLNVKNVYLIPFGQDSPGAKPNSLKGKMDLMADTITMALQGKQLQPVLVGLAT